MIDLDEWEERAAILEFEQGMTRFAAETGAARSLGFRRFEATNAKRQRDSEQARGHGSAVERHDADHLPGVLGASAEQEGSLPQRVVPVGRDSGALSPLRMEVRGEL